MAEELTTEMHEELIGGEISPLDLRVMAVFGAIRRGEDKQARLRKYDLTEAEYDSNLDRVLSQP